MERWLNKVAVVSGASSGIGAKIAADLIKNGFIVVALARRIGRLYENQVALAENLQMRYHPRKCDVTNEAEVKDTFAWIENTLGGTDVLVNNAGIAAKGPLLTSEDDTESFRNVVDTNVMSVVYCVREAFYSMKKRNFDGHIVIINSVLGHSVPMYVAEQMNIYPATKHAVTAMVEIYRQEFTKIGTKVKITSISPGVVETEFLPHMGAYRDAGKSLLYPEDVSNAVLYALGTPPHVQIHELVIKPIGEEF